MNITERIRGGEKIIGSDTKIQNDEIFESAGVDEVIEIEGGTIACLHIEHYDFIDRVEITGAHISESVFVRKNIFGDLLSFSETHFSCGADFSHNTIDGSLDFDGCTFDSFLDLQQTSIDGNLYLRNITLVDNLFIAGMIVDGQIFCDDITLALQLWFQFGYKIVVPTACMRALTSRLGL